VREGFGPPHTFNEGTQVPTEEEIKTKDPKEK